jgi:hypothetical protein
LPTPRRCSSAAIAALARKLASKLTRSSSKMVIGRSPWRREKRASMGSEGGAFFQTRVGTPRIVTVSISKRAPGAVSAALTSAMVMCGQAGSRSKPSIMAASYRATGPNCQPRRKRLGQGHDRNPKIPARHR